MSQQPPALNLALIAAGTPEPVAAGAAGPAHPPSITKAATSDSVDDTLNYKLVAKRVQQFVSESSFQLVETLAEKIAGIVLDEFAVSWVRVRVNKPGAIRGARDVGVVIERGARPDGA